MNNRLSRRDFGKLSAAAFGGLVAGAALQGCGKKEPAPAAGGSGDGGKNKVAARHACRGLNECKGQGAGGDNACAGQGTCATVGPYGPGQNDCKFLGGCGANSGANECKGQGGCAVPIKADHGDAWADARAAFEARMKAKGVKVGEAPPEK